MGYKLHSLDGDIGKVKDFFFDDQHWAVRYLVADTGNWLESRQVLLSPHSLLDVREEGHYLTTNLSKQQIADSPSLDTDMPVSRQFEEDYFEYYGWPMYWSGPFMWGNYSTINNTVEKTVHLPTEGGLSAQERTWDPHLCSAQDVSGQRIHATDGDIGGIHDFIIDDLSWAIRYLVIDTGHWWSGKHLLLSPRWVARVNWLEPLTLLDISRQDIEKSPEYTEKTHLTREYEIHLHQHYQRPGYWSEESHTGFRH